MKVMVVCGHGLGTSLIMEMAVKKIFGELGVSAEVDHEDLGSAKGSAADMYIGTKDIAQQLEAQGVSGKIVALKNMVDKVDMKARIEAALQDMGKL